MNRFSVIDTSAAQQRLFYSTPLELLWILAANPSGFTEGDEHLSLTGKSLTGQPALRLTAK